MSAFAGVLAMAAFTAWAPAHALQDFDACVVGAMEGSAGTVESVREVPIARDLHGFEPDTLARSLSAETARELVVRLDVGPLVVFTQREPHRLTPGQRVRVRLNGRIARVEPDSADCATPLAYSPSG
jgi:hypothetical protein